MRRGCRSGVGDISVMALETNGGMSFVASAVGPGLGS